jgi:hypothetical protein
MKLLMLLSVCFLITFTNVKSQNVQMQKSYNTFDDLLKAKKENKSQLKILENFRNKYTEKDRFYIEEYQDYYQITVSHKSTEGYSGGAECYKIDKQTGETEMLWHEHPMKIDR